MAKERIVIEIDGDSRGAVKASKQAGSSISKLGKILGGLALAGGGLFLAKKGFDLFTNAIKNSLGFLKESIKLTGEQELQEKKLGQAMKSTGKFTEKTFKSFKQYAKELQAVTRSGDEAILAVMAMLQTFKLEEEVLKDATLATLNLAAATGQDLQSAAILLGKAAVGEIGTLSRYGIIIDQAKFAAEGFQVVLDELAVEFGGQAQAQAETFVGRMDQMKNTFGDLREEIGDAFLPVLTDIINKISEGGGLFETFGKGVGNLASSLREWAELKLENIEEFIDIMLNADYGEIQRGLGSIGDALGAIIGNKKEGAIGAEESYQNFIDGLGEGMKTLSATILGMNVLIKSLSLIFKLLSGISIVVNFLSGIGLFFISLGQEGQREFKLMDEGIENLKETMTTGIDEIEEAHQEFQDIIEQNNKEITASFKREFGESKVAALGDLDAILQSAIRLQSFVDAMHGANIFSTHTITTQRIESGDLEGFITGARRPQESTAPTMPTLNPFPTIGRQLGGMILGNQFATDLNIPLVKGEAVLPASLVKAIKEGQGSFAGVDGTTGNTVTNNFNIAELVVREEADVQKIGKELHEMQLREQRGGGFR